MALAGKMAATRFNEAAFQPVAHRVFTLVSDGDVMEGISGKRRPSPATWASAT
jgi:transketolase